MKGRKLKEERKEDEEREDGGRGQLKKEMQGRKKGMQGRKLKGKRKEVKKWKMKEAREEGRDKDLLKFADAPAEREGEWKE